MSIFKEKEKSYNRIIMDGALYQLMVRYLDVDYNVAGVKHRSVRNCPYIMIGKKGDKYSIKFNYRIFPKNDLCLRDFYEIMTDIYLVVSRTIKDNPVLNVDTWKEYDHYVADRIYGICNNIMTIKTMRPLFVFVDELRQNRQIFTILKDNRRKGLDLHHTVIFHENQHYLCEDTYNVQTMTLASERVMTDASTVLLVYTGTYFDPGKRTAPTVPTLDYIIARSSYARYKIGSDVGFEAVSEEAKNSIFHARAMHDRYAHDFCKRYVESYIAKIREAEQDNTEETEN